MSSSSSVNLIGRVSHFFAVNRPLSILLLLTVLLFGLFSFWLTPKQYNPEIVRPAFLISLHYEGATVDDAVNRVVYELTEKIRTVPGVDDVYSEVHDGAAINTTVIFEVGYDATKAKLDLLSQIEQHKYLKSGFVSNPSIMEINPETIPVLQIVFGSKELTTMEVREKVVELSRALGRVDDVSEVSVHGGYVPSLVVEVDPTKLTALQVGVSDVVGAIESGQVRQLDGGINSGNYKIEFVFDGKADTAAEVGSLIIKDDVRVRDVAAVYEGTAGDRPYVLYKTDKQQGEVVVLGVSKVEGSSAPVVTSAVLEELNGLIHHSEYSDLTYKVVGDDGETAAHEIYGLTKNLLTSIVIVAVVLMLFLSTRAAAVVLVAIPVTLLIVFGLGLLFDQTINRITLFALILSLGLLVDSAIVVVENIYSHVREWRASDSPHSHERVIAGAVHEIGVGLLLSTLTSVIVFLPMGYITGMMGPYMGPIAFFVPVALIVSLMVAIVVTPFVAAHLITGEDKKNVINGWFSAQMDRLIVAYGRFLSRILADRRSQRRLLRGALFMFLISLLLPLFALVHFQMLPKADMDQFYVYVDLPVEVSAEATRSFTERVSQILLTDDDVLNVQEYVAEPPVIDFNGMFKGAQNRVHSYQSSVRVNLVKAEDRNRSSTEIVNELRALIHKSLSESASYVRFMEEPPGPPVRATLVAKVSADNEDVREHVADRFMEAVSGVTGVVDLYTTQEDPVGRVVYDFDHEAAGQLGVSIESVRAVLALLGEGYDVTEYLGAAEAEFSPVVVTIPAEQRRTPGDIAGLSVMSQSGVVVPLSAVLKTTNEVRPSRVDLDNATPVVYVTAEVENRSIVYAMIDTMKMVVDGEVAGVTVTDWGLFGMTLTDEESHEEATIRWGGEWEMTLENFRDLGIAMMVALLLVYAVLVAQYNRFSTPAYILVTVPLGLVGILWGFLVLDNGFSIYLTATALIGFIALIGLVVNNAIIFLEYVEQMQNAGHEYREALIEAGKARMRPILLTSLTTVLGSLTIASDPVWSGLAWAIVFGLSLSTMLTLVVYPTLLMYFTGHTQNNQ